MYLIGFTVPPMGMMKKSAHQLNDTRGLLDGLSDPDDSVDTSQIAGRSAMAAPRSPDSPWITLIVGVVIAAIGGLIIATSDSSAASFIGIALTAVGGMITQVGIIAMAVELALVRSEARRYWQNRA